MGKRKQPFGYRMENGEIVIEQREAEIVQNIFYNYISGMGFCCLADSLNCQGIQYCQGKSWNKNAIARLLEDERYIGKKDFPAIITEELMDIAATIRSGKYDPCLITDCKKVLRRLCGGHPPQCLEKEILRLVNRLIEEPALIQCPSSEDKTNLEVINLQAELDKLLEEEIVDETAARSVILHLAAEKYDEIGNSAYETQRLRELFSRQETLAELDGDLLSETISSINMQQNGRVYIKLKNGQIIEGRCLHG